MATDQYCGECKPKSGPYTPEQIVAHLRDQHRSLFANGAGPPVGVRG